MIIKLIHCLMLPQMKGYVKCFDETKYTWLLIKNEELLETCKRICDKVSNLMKKGFPSEPMSNKKYLKTKTKSYDSSK